MIYDSRRGLASVWSRGGEAARRAQFSEFYEATYNQALAFVRVKAVGHCDPESIVGDAFALVWRELDETGRLPGRGWLYGVLRNKLGDLYRRWDREAKVSPESPIAVEALSDQVVDAIAVRRILEGLPEGLRDALVLTYWLDLSAPDAALVLETSPGAFRVRLTRARAAFKAAYDEVRELAEEVG